MNFAIFYEYKKFFRVTRQRRRVWIPSEVVSFILWFTAGAPCFEGQTAGKSLMPVGSPCQKDPRWNQFSSTSSMQAMQVGTSCALSISAATTSKESLRHMRIIVNPPKYNICTTKAACDNIPWSLITYALSRAPKISPPPTASTPPPCQIWERYL